MPKLVAEKMKKYRALQARQTLYAYVDLRQFLDLKQGFTKGLVLSTTPGSKQTLVRVTICKNRKKQ